MRDGEKVEGVTLVSRCEHDAVLRGEQGDVFINIKACNEWDSKVSEYIVCHDMYCSKSYSNL